jgi:inward rectifier potassium channel
MKTTRASQQNTGLGTNANNYGGRFINKDGTANVARYVFSYTASVGTTL